MNRLFAVILQRGPAYRPEKPLEAQQEWEAHRTFMNALVGDGFVVLGGPLEGTSEVLLIFRAASTEEIMKRWSEDPWVILDLLQMSRIIPWDLRLGKIEKKYPAAG
ncbi:MAG TPA: hypothetical protein VNU44_07595 [Bryobacteraceae bacterium]|nr:hypothetical protein [Bryobacteraceae bacterium]